MNIEHFSEDENDVDIENNGFNTFCLDDDDECVIEDVDVDDSDDDSVEHRVSMNKLFAEGHGSDNYVHDQLPSVEEVKASNAYSPTMRLLAKAHRRKLYLTIVIAALAAIALSVTISFGVFKRTNTKKVGKEPIYVTGDQDAVDKEPISAGGGQDAIGDRFEQTLDFIFNHHVSTLPNLKAPMTPEHRAAQFLAGGDAYNAPIGDFYSPEGRRFLERYVLALFYYQTAGSKWDDEHNFLTPIDHCQWNNQYTTPQGTFIKGVQCNDDGFVVDIDLSNNNVVATSIPYELHYMMFLERLHLHGNPLQGVFPNVSKLKNLKSIGLMNTEISGVIPNSIGDMTQLTTLAIGQTKISKSIPHAMTQLTNLRILGLDGLGLVGTIENLMKLSNLEALYLEDNNLSGDLYKNNWMKMKELDISNNNFSGSIPDSMLENTNLEVLDMHANNFFGYFPTEIFPNPALQYFSVSKNRFMGSLTDRIGYLKNLKHLDISHNLLTGTLPDTLSLLTDLVSLHTTGNTFSRQPLGNYLSPLTKLQELSMKGNSITGTLPEYFANMLELQLLDLDGNELKGTISTYMGILHNLKALMLNRNYLTGTIPSELKKLEELEVLLLDGNNLSGKTTEICQTETFLNIQHFVTDCYPSMKTEAGPEVECRCCTLCCNDENPDCNNKDWSTNYDPKLKYGYIRPAYEYSLDQAPEGWQKKAERDAESHSTGPSN